MLFDQRNNLFGNNALYKAIVAYLILYSESRRLSVVNAYHDVEDEVSQRKQAGVGGPKSLFRVGKLTEVFFDIAASLTQDFKSQYWTGLRIHTVRKRTRGNFPSISSKFNRIYKSGDIVLSFKRAKQHNYNTFRQAVIWIMHRGHNIHTYILHKNKQTFINISI